MYYSEIDLSFFKLDTAKRLVLTGAKAHGTMSANPSNRLRIEYDTSNVLEVQYLACTLGGSYRAHKAPQGQNFGLDYTRWIWTCIGADDLYRLACLMHRELIKYPPNRLLLLYEWLHLKTKRTVNKDFYYTLIPINNKRIFLGGPKEPCTKHKIMELADTKFYFCLECEMTQL